MCGRFWCRKSSKVSEKGRKFIVSRMKSSARLGVKSKLFMKEFIGCRSAKSVVIMNSAVPRLWCRLFCSSGASK